MALFSRVYGGCYLTVKKKSTKESTGIVIGEYIDLFNNDN
jgi:hypothetical protein